MRRHLETRVRDLMTSNVVALRETDVLYSARELMEEVGIRHVPVIDDRRHVIGVLSTDALAAALAAGARDFARLEGWMDRAVRTVRPGTPAHEAARLLLRCHIGALPVVDDDERLVGIVTRADFLAVAHDALDRHEGEGPPAFAEAG